jgi:hypothetical protein
VQQLSVPAAVTKSEQYELVAVSFAVLLAAVILAAVSKIVVKALYRVSEQLQPCLLREPYVTPRYCAVKMVLFLRALMLFQSVFIVCADQYCICHGSSFLGRMEVLCLYCTKS